MVSAMCADGTRSPEAPEMPNSGTRGVTPLLSIPTKSSATSLLVALLPLRRLFNRIRHCGPNDLRRHGGAYACRMASNEVELQLSRCSGRTTLSESEPNPVFTPVSNLSPGKLRLQLGAESLHLLQALRTGPDSSILLSNFNDSTDGQSASVDGYDHWICPPLDS